MATRPKAASLLGLRGLNPAWSMDLCLLWVLCVVTAGPIPRPEGSSACVSECDHMQQQPYATKMGTYKEDRQRK